MILVLNHFQNLEEVERQMAAHRAYLDTLYASKTLVFSGRRKQAHLGGLVLFNLDDPEQVDALMKQDPFVSSGAIRYELIEFTPTKYDPRFAAFLETKM